jgi:AcrR family transcriptional regulator
MRELAAATGVQAASLYEHMPSKERLLFDLVLLAHTEHRDRVRAAVLDAGTDTADRLARVVRAHVALHAEFPLLASVANNELHALSEANLAEVRAVRGEAEDTILALIERGMRQGRFDCPDAWLATAAIGGMGIRVAAWFRPGGSYSVDEVCDTYAELALRIVGAHPEPAPVNRR